MVYMLNDEKSLMINAYIACSVQIVLRKSNKTKVCLKMYMDVYYQNSQLSKCMQYLKYNLFLTV